MNLTEEMGVEFDYGYKGKSFVFIPFSIVLSVENLPGMKWH